MKPHKKLLFVIAAAACLLEAYMLFSLGVLDSFINRYTLFMAFILALAVGLMAMSAVGRALNTDMEEKRARKGIRSSRINAGSAARAAARQMLSGVLMAIGQIRQVWEGKHKKWA